MLKKIKNLGIFWKISIPFATGFVSILLFIVFDVIPQVRENVIQNKKDQLQYIVELAYSQLSALEKEIKDGKITEQDAKTSALKLIGNLRYDTKNYIFIFDNEKFIYHLAKKNIGKPLDSYKDKKEKKFMVAMVDILKSSPDGYVDYYFPKPGIEGVFPKLSYVRKFEAWGWNLGTGVYIDDVEEEIAEVSSHIYTVFAIIGFFIMLVCVLIIQLFVIKPLGKLNLFALQVSNGEIKSDIENFSNDEIGNLANSFKKVVKSIRTLDSELNLINQEMIAGNLSKRTAPENVNGAYANILNGINKMLNTLIEPINISSEYMLNISNGNLPDKITADYPGDFNEIKISVNKCIDAIKLLISDSNQLAYSAEFGQLSFRADPNNHNGDFKKVIIGMNQTFDNLLKPLNMASYFLDEVASGSKELTEITEEFHGDYNQMKQNINELRNIILDLVNNISSLIQASQNGNLGFRANSAGFKGNWEWIINGLNRMLDGFIIPIDEAKRVLNLISSGVLNEKITMEFKGDLDQIKSSVNGLHSWLENLVAYITQIANGDTDAQINQASQEDQIHQYLVMLKSNIQALTNDVNELANAAMAGQLSHRADAGMHSGEYKRIIEGFNLTIDSIMAPINEAVGVLQHMAAGNLSISMTNEYSGDHSLLKDSINTTLLALNSLLKDVHITVNEVTLGAKQVSEASGSLSQAATEQAASLEEITSSMTEIGSQIRQNAVNARQASEFTNATKESTEKGKDVMGQLNTAMNEISESSKNIARINKVIDEIAFQTNLLALNAAVEAARAGRHGKGFSVVAEEVRNLAARSSAAARETSDLIETSIIAVDNGLALSSRTYQVLDEIHTDSVKSAEIVEDIATLSSEQSMAIAQISEGLNQLDKVTQTNTAGAEQSASASNELSNQASSLKQSLQSFTLNDEDNNTFSSSTLLSTNANRHNRSLSAENDTSEDEND